MNQDFDPNVFDPNQQDFYYLFDDSGRKYGRSYQWQEAWKEAVLNPSLETYSKLISDPNATLERAFIWLVIALSIQGILSGIAQLIFGSIFEDLFANQFQTTDGTEINFFSPSNSAAGVICFTPFQVFFALVILMILLGVIHIVARLLGGQGDFDKVVYGVAVFYAPLAMISGLLQFIPIAGACLSFLLIFYYLYLAVVAVKAVHRFGWGEAAVSALSPVLGVFACICACVTLIFTAAVAA